MPDGRQVYVPLGGSWPDSLGEMPWVEAIAIMPSAGAPMELVDNTALIDDELAMWNWIHD